MKSSLFNLLCIGLIFSAGCSKSQPALENAQKTGSIVGGTPVSAELASGPAVIKSTVALMTVRNEKLLSFCSGTLIGPDLVLTAGHCTKVGAPATVLVFFGTVLPSELTAPGLVQAAQYSVHPDFDTTFGRLNDVALIKLEKPAPAGFEPVALLEPSYELQKGGEILLAGFGLVQDIPVPVRTKVLNLVRVKIAEVQETLVVTDQNEGHGACAGDSGGPAYFELPNELLVFGDTRGPQPGSVDCEHFGEYTYSSKFKDFILKAASDLGSAAPIFKLPN